MILGLMLAAGIWWVVQPPPNAAPSEELMMTTKYAPWISAGGVALAAIAGAVLILRYRLVRKILSRGVAVKGIVEVSDRHDTNMHSNSSTDTMQTAPTYVYYVTIRYAMHGRERKVRLRLPFSPGTYGIKQDGEIDLLALDEAPDKPLIRAVYLNAPPMKRNPWLRL